MTIEFSLLSEMPPAPVPGTPAQVFDPLSFAFVGSFATFITQMNTNLAQLNTLLAGLAQTEPIAAYVPATTYNFPDVVACTNGQNYRCVGTGIQGIDPITDDGTSWVIPGRLPSTIRDYFINGNFGHWDYGTSQSAATPYIGSDNRFVNYVSNSGRVHSRQAFTLGQTDVPGEPEFYSRTIVTSSSHADAQCFKSQRVLRVRTLAGDYAITMFWARADAIKNVAVAFSQNFGSGGSAQIHGIGAVLVALSTVWQQYWVAVEIPSISGKTIGSTPGYLECQIWFEAGANMAARAASLGNQSGTFDIADWHCYNSSTPVVVDRRTKEEERRLCNLHYMVLGSNQLALTGFYGYGPTGGTMVMRKSIPEMAGTPTVAKAGTWAVANCSQPIISSPQATGFDMTVTVTTTGLFDTFPNSADDTIILEHEV